MFKMEKKIYCNTPQQTTKWHQPNKNFKLLVSPKMFYLLPQVTKVVFDFQHLLRIRSLCKG